MLVTSPTLATPVVSPATASRIRLVNVVPTLLCGGTENQVMTLSRSLDSDRFDLEFACLRRWGPFIQELDDRGIPLSEYRTQSFYSPSAVAQQTRFAKHLARQRVDIVHSYSFYGNVFAVPPARLAGTPVVIASIRDRGAYLRPLQTRVQRYVCQFADAVLVNAEAVKDWLIGDGFDGTRIRVIHNGVDLRPFSVPPESARIRRDLGVSANARLVAVVSRLNRLKGLEQFLDAAAIVGTRLPDVRFLIVGEAPPHDLQYLDELKAKAGRLGVGDRVIFTGLRGDVPALLQCVSVAVMPSLNEALSNSLLEAMAAGAPTVATRVGGTPEALADGETGVLVPPGDVPALARAISLLLDSPALARRLGAAARRRIADRFSIERMVSLTAQLYDELLEKKGRGRGRTW